MAGDPPHLRLGAASPLEERFLRWILVPATRPEIVQHVVAQAEAAVNGRKYSIDYRIDGASNHIAVELDGYAFHSDRDAFTYDRLRQNDLHAAGLLVLRFSWDAIRSETARCVSQLQGVLLADSTLAPLVIASPAVATPDDMDADPLWAATRFQPGPPSNGSYFAGAREHLNLTTLRRGQREAFEALANYYGGGGARAATVMAVGAGKTGVGVAACVGLARKRALIITPGTVIRGTFDTALDPTLPGNVLYGLSGGPLLPGWRRPKVRVLDRAAGTISAVSRAELLAADIIVTNFHSLGDADDPGSVLAKLQADDIDLVVVDEAHIAAAASYSFERLDGKPIDADVVYRYRLIDSISDGCAKRIRVGRFSPDAAQTVYEIAWPDGLVETIFGRDALLKVLEDEVKLSSIAARSTESIRQVARAVRAALDRQAVAFEPLRPRVLFAALGRAHAEQIAAVAREEGIATDVLHHTMPEARLKAVRQRFESPSGDLEGIVQLRMLGQGYDFPPICVVAPMRPYLSFAGFYQFVGRGIRAVTEPEIVAHTPVGEQWLDVVYHSELGLDEHLDRIRVENDMDPSSLVAATLSPDVSDIGEVSDLGAVRRPETTVISEVGAVEARIMHTAERVAAGAAERLREALAPRYAQYAETSENPVSFDTYIEIAKQHMR